MSLRGIIPAALLVVLIAGQGLVAVPTVTAQPTPTQPESAQSLPPADSPPATREVPLPVPPRILQVPDLSLPRPGDEKLTYKETPWAEVPPDQQGWTIRVSTPKEPAALITLGLWQAKGSLEVVAPGPGLYQVRIRLAGYHPWDRVFPVAEGRQYDLRVHLVPLAGTLEVEALGSDGLAIPSRNLEIILAQGSADPSAPLGPGQYSLTLRAFGYEDWSGRIPITDGFRTRLQVALEPATLRILDARIHRPVLRPGAPGILGRSGLRFEVSKEGRGRVLVSDAEGSTLAEVPLGPFTRRHQDWTWDPAGLPDGAYTLTLSLDPIPGESLGEPSTLSRTLVLDSSAFVKFRARSPSGSGTTLLMDTYTLHPGSVDFSMGVSGLGSPALLEPEAAFRLGIQRSIEFSVAFAAPTMVQEAASQALVLPLIKGRILPPRPDGGLSLAWSLGGSIPLVTGASAADPARSSTSPPGARLSLALDQASDPWHILVNAGLAWEALEADLIATGGLGLLVDHEAWYASIGLEIGQSLLSGTLAPRWATGLEGGFLLGSGPFYTILFAGVDLAPGASLTAKPRLEASLGLIY